jgi:2-polyprenylphenol 6-hydroxylase
MFDVLIVGGGAAGACAGALLAGAAGTRPLSVALLEPHPVSVPLPDEPSDARVVALSRASERVLARAGAWQALKGARLMPYERMRVWHESVPAEGAGVLVFDAAEAGEPNLGYIVEHRALQGALLAAFTHAGGHLESAAFTSLAIADEGVTVTTSRGTLAARLVIGADGAASALRTAAGLSASTSSYGQTAIVATVATERPHADSAWQRFMRDGTLAFLPLKSGASSIVWSADDALAAQLLRMPDTEFAQALDRASDLALGHTRLASEPRSFALTRVRATRYVAQRVALIGDAAHVVHPLAGQGVNLGLLDAAALAQQVAAAWASGEDPGALRVLRSYERWRKSEVAAIAAGIDAFDRLLAHGQGPLARLAQRGMSMVNSSQELKRFFIGRALGLSGELPQAARRIAS